MMPKASALPTDSIMPVSLNDKQSSTHCLEISPVGASNTFLEQTYIEKFKLLNTNLNIKAQGAGPTQINAKIYKNCSIIIGDWMIKRHKIYLSEEVSKG